MTTLRITGAQKFKRRIWSLCVLGLIGAGGGVGYGVMSFRHSDESRDRYTSALEQAIRKKDYKDAHAHFDLLKGDGLLNPLQQSRYHTQISDGEAFERFSPTLESAVLTGGVREGHIVLEEKRSDVSPHVYQQLKEFVDSYEEPGLFKRITLTDETLPDCVRLCRAYLRLYRNGPNHALVSYTLVHALGRDYLRKTDSHSPFDEILDALRQFNDGLKEFSGKGLKMGFDGAGFYESLNPVWPTEFAQLRLDDRVTIGTTSESWESSESFNSAVSKRGTIQDYLTERAQTFREGMSATMKKNDGMAVANTACVHSPSAQSNLSERWEVCDGAPHTALFLASEIQTIPAPTATQRKILKDMETTTRELYKEYKTR